MSRPTLTGETLTVQQVNLTAAQIATARRLGDGNLSAGVRKALTNADTTPCQHSPKANAK